MRKSLRVTENVRVTSLLLLTAVVIFVAEGAVMLLFHSFRQEMRSLTPSARGILDASLLTIAAFPALYLLLFRPLLREMKRRAQVERSKDDLLSILPHELRTPLATIREGISQISDGHLGPTTPDQVECLRVTERNVQRLSRMFDKVMLAAQLLMDQVEYAFEPTRMAQIVDALSERFRPIAQEKGVVFQVRHESPLPTCTVDARRFNEALGEIVENAVALTPKGREVVLSCQAQPGGAEFTVRDCGPGIPADDVPMLSERLHSVGGIYERKTGGLGLGLFIAQAIIRAHGSSLSVSSIPGQGSQIRVLVKREPSRWNKDRE